MYAAFGVIPRAAFLLEQYLFRLILKEFDIFER